MDASTEARIVEIILPLKNLTRNHFTGYVLSDGLILTCLHGFKDHPDYNPSIDICIRTPNYEIALPFDAVCFDELINEQGFFQYNSEDYSEEFDIVIIRCVKVKAPRPENLQLAVFDDPGEWQGGGYPFFSRNCKDTGGFANFNGTFRVPGNVTNLNLTVSQPLLPEMIHWGSVSGSPIFIRGKLTGIVRGYTQYDNGNGGKEVIQLQLEAVYLKKLWEEDPKFKHFFKFQDASQKVIKHVVRFLNDSNGNRVRFALGEDSPENLVGRLQTASIESFLDEMNQVSDLSSDLVKHFTNSFIPFYFSEQALIVEQMSSSATIDIECVSEIIAEFTMSAFSGREANVAFSGDASVRNGELYISGGKQALARMPESGIDNIGHDINAIAEDCKRRKALPDIVVDQKRLAINTVSLEKYLVSRLARYMSTQSREDALKEVNIVLEQDSRANQHYYMVVKIDKDTEAGKQMLSQIEIYKIKFPNLFFINMTSTGRMDDRERLLNRKLPSLISE